MWQDSSKDAAFSLLEILVALMVLAMSYAALTQTIGASLVQARSGADLIRAVELAERLHLDLDDKWTTQPNGRDILSGLDWAIAIQPFDMTADAGNAGLHLATIRIQKPDHPSDLFVLRSVVKKKGDPD